MRHLNYPIFLSFAALASAAQAQSDPDFDLGTIILKSDALDEIGVSSEDLSRTNPADLQDVFKSEPTIAVGSSIPASQKLYVNGVEETNLSVTIDGSRQNNKIFHHNATTLIDPDLLKQVRIDPGVAPADAGAGALAGSIAYETKDVADLLAPGLNFGGMVKGEYDSNGDIFTTNTSFYGRSGGFEGLIFFKTADGDVREDGRDREIIGSGTGLLSGLAKVAYQSETGHRIELSYERVNDDEARPYRANIGQIIGGRPVPLTRTYDLERENLVITYTDATPEGWWDPKISLAYSVTDLDIPEDTQLIFGTTDSFNGVIQNRFPVANGSVTAGLDFYAEEAELDYRFLANPAFDEAGTEKARNIGLFAQARLNLSDRARLSFGGRADFQKFEGVDGSTRTDKGLSGNVSGEYDVTGALTVSAGYSHVWAGVPLAENFIINPAWTYPANGIDSVTADNIFVAARAEFSGWTLNGKIFKTEINDARTPDYRLGPALSSDLESRGYELGARYNWASGFFAIGYANIDTRIDGNVSDSFTGRYLTTPIGEVITLEVAHEFAAQGVTVGADAQLVLEETNTYDVGTGLRGQSLPAYEVVNAFAEYTPKKLKNLTIRGEVNNIFDETYASRATYGQEYGTVVPLREPGRSFRISASMRF